MGRLDHFLNASQFNAHVSALPAWEAKQDDDPNWVRPTEEVTGRAPVPYDAHNDYSRRLLNPDNPPALTRVPVEGIRQTQHQINLMAVKHYVENGPNGPKKFDPDGCLGTDHPVIIEHPEHGHVIADGNSRFAAARIRGDQHIEAHVLPAARNPAHVEAVQLHMETQDRLYKEHAARVKEVEALHGKGWLARDAHPDLKKAHQESQEILRPALDANDRRLQRALSR